MSEQATIGLIDLCDINDMPESVAKFYEDYLDEEGNYGSDLWIDCDYFRGTYGIFHDFVVHFDNETYPGNVKVTLIFSDLDEVEPGDYAMLQAMKWEEVNMLYRKFSIAEEQTHWHRYQPNPGETLRDAVDRRSNPVIAYRGGSGYTYGLYYFQTPEDHATQKDIEFHLASVNEHDNPDVDIYAEYRPDGEFTQLAVIAVHNTTYETSSRSVYGMDWLKKQRELNETA